MTNELPQEHPVETSNAPPPTPRGRSAGLLFAYSCAVAALTLAIDLGSKQLALRFLDTDTRIPLFGDLLGLQLAFNTGAAFSLGSQLTPFITLLGLVASGLLIRAAVRARRRVNAIAIGLILGGALGNLVDRISAPPGFGRGAVTDFLAYGHLFIGNIADIAIGAGVVLYLLAVGRMKCPPTRRSNIRQPAAGTEPAASWVNASTASPSPSPSPEVPRP